MARKRKFIDFVKNGNEFENQKKHHPASLPAISILPVHQIRIWRKWHSWKQGIPKLLKQFCFFLLLVIIAAVCIAIAES